LCAAPWLGMDVPWVLKESHGGSILGAIALGVVLMPIGHLVLRNRITALRALPLPEPQSTSPARWLW
jgi:hypothetical protein